MVERVAQQSELCALGVASGFAVLPVPVLLGDDVLEFW